MAAVEALGRFTDADTAADLIKAWPHATPTVQDQITVALGSRAAWSAMLLDACGSNQITPGRIPRATRVALLGDRDASLRERAKSFRQRSKPAREAIAHYQSALSLTGDVARGSKVYERVCASATGWVSADFRWVLTWR